MIAVECDSIVHDGRVSVPRELEGRRVKLVVLADLPGISDRHAALQRAIANRDTVSGFTPMSREEANER